MLRDSVGVDRVDLDEVLRSGIQASNVEHRLVGCYVDDHCAGVGLVHLKKMIGSEDLAKAKI